MARKKNSVEVLEIIKSHIFSKKLEEKFKVMKSDFTRKRKQSFASTLMFLMNFLTKSLAVEVINFIKVLKRDCKCSDVKFFTKSAFCQYRKKIKPEVFKELSNMLVTEFYTDNELGVKLWNGFRVLGVDGSMVVLPNTKELAKLYGTTKNKTTTEIVQARASVLYDVLNNYVIDSCFVPLNIPERDLAIKHLEYSNSKDLIIYDRGYPSYDFIYINQQKKVNFLFRAKVGFNNVCKKFISSKKQSLIVDFYPNKNENIDDKPYDKQTPIKVRLVRVELPNNQVELLITSLLDMEKYPNAIFKDLYFKRWNVETFYDELKNKLKIEYFTGNSSQSILQDFYATIFVSNIQTLIVSDLIEEIEEKNKSTKLDYKINTNVSYGILKDRIVELFFSNDTMENITNQIKNLFKIELIPIRPNRTYERNTNKYRVRYKPKTTKNQKDAI